MSTHADATASVSTADRRALFWACFRAIAYVGPFLIFRRRGGYSAIAPVPSTADNK